MISPEQFNIGEYLEQKRTGITPGQSDHWSVFGYDIENRTSSLPKRSDLLLSGFCYDDINDEVIVIDNTTVDSKEVFISAILQKSLFICHNADHEARFGVATDFIPMRYGCTMVNDKRLLSGQEGFKFDWVSVLKRRLGVDSIPIWTDKDIRSRFKDCTFFDDELILYNAADTIRLKKVYYAQLAEAESTGQIFLHKTINSRLIRPFAEAEMTGILHNSTKWKEIAGIRAQQAHGLCLQLDQFLTDVHGIDLSSISPDARKKKEQKERQNVTAEARKTKILAKMTDLEKKGKTNLKSYQILQESLQKIAMVLDTANGANTGTVHLNWNSPVQANAALLSIGCPIPTISIWDPGSRSRGPKNSFKKEARNNWFTANVDSPFWEFMRLLDRYKKTIHNVQSFGDTWVEQYVNVETGRVHTLLDQAGTETGRPSSGSKGQKKEHANMLQIPKSAEYRECFLAGPGRKMITVDYKNCEGVVMISLSGDLDMKKITELSDQHSYLGTKCWRNVYTHRYETTGDLTAKELSETYEMNQTTPEKVKERDIFKNSGGLFPVAYGVAAAKVSGAAGITDEEGQVMIDTIKAEIPKVITFLDSKSREALQTGYVVHNKRSGSRRGFSPILDEIHYGWKANRNEKSDIEFAARNSPIQGTNSDLMKEAIIMIDLWKRLFKQDIQFLLTVYDEYVASVPADKAEEYAHVISQFMIRAAQNYLIPEITMGVDCRIADYWKK